MATFKACVRKQRADGYYTVFIRCTHRRKADYISTEKMIDSKGLTKTNEIKDIFVMAYCANKITSFIDKLNKLDIDQWDVKEVTEYLKKEDEDICFSDYARKYKIQMALSGMERNARNYELAYQHLERFAGTEKLMFSRFTTSFVSDWIKSLMQTARAKEMYPVCIRQIFKSAIIEFNDYDRGLIRIKTNPWLKVKIPESDIPEKRAISPEKVREFFSAPLPESKFKLPVPELGRDVSFMVMCLAGINTVDIYHLKKENIKEGGILGYNRRKTMKFRRDKAYLEIKVPEILKSLFEKYKTKEESEYLFNFSERYSSEDSFNANVNIGIRSLCESIGIPKEERYSVYTFRHTWGTVAQNNCGASYEQIGFAMNHSSAHKVTQGYIKPDFSQVFLLNQKVIDYLFFSAKDEKKCEGGSNSMDLRLSAKYQVRGEVFFRGRLLGSLCDIGFNNKEEVIQELIKQLPLDIPNRSMVQFRIENVDKKQIAIYERMKGKGI